MKIQYSFRCSSAWIILWSTLIAPMVVACGGGDASSNSSNSTGAGTSIGMPDPVEDCAENSFAHAPKPAVVELGKSNVSENWFVMEADRQGAYVASTSDRGATTDILAIGLDGSPARTLAHFDEGVSFPSLATDDDNVYVRADADIRVIPKTGGAATSLAGFTDSAASRRKQISVDDRYVYISVMNDPLCKEKSGSILSFDKSTGEKKVLVPDLICPEKVVADGGYVYFVVLGSYDSNTGLNPDATLQRVSRDGGTAQILLQKPLESGNVAIGATDIFVVPGATLSGPTGPFLRIPKSGGTPQPIGTVCSFLGNVEPAPDGIYYNDGQSYVHLAVDGKGVVNDSDQVNPSSGYFVSIGSSVIQLEMSSKIWQVTLQ